MVDITALILSIIRTLLNKEYTTKIQILIILHNHDCGKADISIMIMKTTSRLFSQSQNLPALPQTLQL